MSYGVINPYAANHPPSFPSSHYLGGVAKLLICCYPVPLVPSEFLVIGGEGGWELL
ncbi:hypothetical protein Acr_08g0006320 [Actinidia rufa]|uniref:Uncharacterized protein n=1 Tax=Actinidia rufa TaxID=165716 RepID=A0A7J0F188_9ERIC|nr:hypothetical protein Acr_08g0006320 [Actinidia rufa]